MKETSAIEVTLLQAFETAQPASANWTADDSAWATRLASTAEVLPDATSSDAQFIAHRAHHAMQRLLLREPGAAKWLSALKSGPAWSVLVMATASAVALSVGLLADSIGSSQRINLLAPPLWALVLWNTVVFLWLLSHWVASWFGSVAANSTGKGALSRGAQKLIHWSSQVPTTAASSAQGAPALQTFGALWSQRSAPLTTARAAVLLHLGSAALALGLIGGMYLRGLVLDYRASWESTFLSTESAHAALSWLLSPAAAISKIALLGFAIPDAAALEALRETHSNASVNLKSNVTSGAVWIHLYAVTLTLFVVLPRLALALLSALRARWLAQQVKLPLSDEYFARLIRQRQGRSARLVVLPYASTPNAAAQLGLRAVLSSTLGDAVDVQVVATLAFGDEDNALALLTDGSTLGSTLSTTLAIALFDLSATPEAENQARLVQLMASRLSTVVVLDETAFNTRFAAAPDRLTQRRAAWLAWASALNTVPVFVNLERPDLKTAERDLLAAMKTPVRA